MNRNMLRRVLLTVLFVSPLEAGVFFLTLFLGTISESPVFTLLRVFMFLLAHMTALLIYLRFLQAFPTGKPRR